MTKKILIWGSESQAMIYTYELWADGYECVLVDPYRDVIPAWLKHSLFIGKGQFLDPDLAGCAQFLVAIGGEHGRVRHDVMRALTSKGLEPHTLRDASANIKPSVRMGPMSVVLQNVTINHKTAIGAAAIINTAASIDHECKIGDGVHIMGAAAIAGRVSIGDWAVVGTNATVLPDIRIGKAAYVGAGAVVTKDVAPGSIVAGVPAIKIGERRPKREEKALEWINEHS